MKDQLVKVDGDDIKRANKIFKVPKKTDEKKKQKSKDDHDD